MFLGGRKSSVVSEVLRVFEASDTGGLTDQKRKFTDPVIVYEGPTGGEYMRSKRYIEEEYTIYYEGERGQERIVRIETEIGRIFYYKGHKGHEQPVLLEDLDRDDNLWTSIDAAAKFNSHHSNLYITLYEYALWESITNKGEDRSKYNEIIKDTNLYQLWKRRKEKLYAEAQMKIHEKVKLHEYVDSTVSKLDALTLGYPVNKKCKQDGK